MRAFKLAFALVRIPKLFISLLLFPLAIGLLLVWVQLLVTGLLVKSYQRTAETYQEASKVERETNLPRLLLYRGKPLKELQVCRWIKAPNGQGIEEVYPSADCRPDRLDVALQVEDPATFDPSAYQKIWNGNIERLHVCRSCEPDVVFDLRGAKPETHISSVWGLLVLSLVTYNEDLSQHYAEGLKYVDMLRDKIGVLVLHLPGFDEPIMLKRMRSTLALILNISSLVLISLWLALRAHKKVLDYFARSGALLPMVATIGKRSFYSAIWILTMMRVSAFLFAAVPLAAVGYYGLVDDEHKTLFFEHNVALIPLWVLTLVASLGLAGLVGSLAELKHRHSLWSFAYRYIPLIVCSIGTAVWAGSFLFETDSMVMLRNGIAAIPIVGMMPVLVAPVFQPPTDIFILHTILTVVLIITAVRHNIRWFAAHLEEL